MPETEPQPAGAAPEADTPAATVSTTGEHKGPVNYSSGTQINSTINPQIKPEFHFGNIGSGGSEASAPRQIPVLEVPGAPEVPPEPAVPAEQPGETPPIPEEDPRDARIRELEERLTGIETRLNEILDAMTAPAPPAPPEEPPVEPGGDEEPEEPETPTAGGEGGEATAALEALSEARDELLKYKIRRSARIHDMVTIRPDRGRQDRDRYREAMEDFRVAADLYLEARYDVHVAATGGDETAVEALLFADEQAIQKQMLQREFELEDEYWNEATSIEDKNFWQRLGVKKNRFVRWYANQKTWKKIGVGLGIGAVTALVASSTAGVGLALLAAGAAARFSLGLANRNASARNVSDKSRKAELGRLKGDYDKLLELADDGDLALGREDILDRLTGRVDKDVERRQRKNQVGTAIILGGAALTGLGFAGVDLIPNVPWLNGNGGGNGNGGHENGLPGNGGDSGGYHNVEFVGPDRITGVNLPQGMDLIHSGNGHLALYDSINHQEILNGGSLPKGLFDQQGNLSFAGREFLRNQGFSLDQMTRLAGRFMTTINRSGG